MNSAVENRKLSLLECKKILNTDGLCYTDEEVLKIRDWLYQMADIAIDGLNKNAKPIADNNEEKNKGTP